MLCKATTLSGYRLNSLEGEIGKVKEFFFDDRYWTIRYLVADTGNWLTGRQVLISASEAGAELVKATRRARQEWLVKRLATLDSRQRETLRNAADLMLALVDEGP